MKKEFNWRDLELVYKQMPAGRTKHAIGLLLKGETVDLAGYPRAEYKVSGHRSIRDFCYCMKRLLKEHEGVEIVGDVVRIPELQKPKSFLRDV